MRPRRQRPPHPTPSLLEEITEGLVELHTEGWQRDALCLEYFPRMDWFHKKGEDTEPAKMICRRCLVHDECREYALRHEIVEGVWGGLSGKQLLREVRQARRDAA